jgi:YD repeat-containing protein
VHVFDAPLENASDGGKGVQGMATITDKWPLTPFNLGLTKQERWLRIQRAGHVSDVFIMRAVSNPDPWALLGLQPDDARLIGAWHYEYDAKLYQLPSDPTENVIDCFDMVAPLDFQATLTSLNSEALDVCRDHGFAFQASNFNWHGDAPPPLSDQNTQTRVQVSVDDFGRPNVTDYENDVFRSDDDICIDYAYATPAAPFPRVLNALSSRRIYACGKAENRNTVESEAWIYDNRTDGSVTDGHVTSHSVDRRATDTGAVFNTIQVFDASYDGNGNVATVRTQRGGAVRTTTAIYDPFGLVPVQRTVDATGLPSITTTVGYDPITLLPTSSTDANQTTRGIDYDGFGRSVRSTVTPAGGTLGVASTTSYLGFTGGDPAGERVALTRFMELVPPANVATANGRTSTTFFDELGRRRRAEIASTTMPAALPSRRIPMPKARLRRCTEQPTISIGPAICSVGFVDRRRRLSTP